jgi:hypothetical protein
MNGIDQVAIVLLGTIFAAIVLGGRFGLDAKSMTGASFGPKWLERFLSGTQHRR